MPHDPDISADWNKEELANRDLRSARKAFLPDNAETQDIPCLAGSARVLAAAVMRGIAAKQGGQSGPSKEAVEEACTRIFELKTHAYALESECNLGITQEEETRRKLLNIVDDVNALARQFSL